MSSRSTPARTTSAKRPCIGTDLANYQKSIVCKGDDGTGSIVAQTASDSAGPLDVTVTDGSDIVCTITNTRETGKLEVVKDLNPSGDPGKFNLQIDGNTDPQGANVGDGGSTGEEPLNTGTHNVGEAAGTGTSLSNYAKSIVCKSDNGSGSTVAQSSGSAGPLNVAVGFGDDIVCTITNTRKTGKLEVVKKLNPSTDPGKFNLQINGNTDPQGANVGDGGSTGEEPLNTGHPHRGRGRGHGHDPGRLPEVDRLQGQQRHGLDRRSDLGRQRRSAERGRHLQLRHRLHDHQHT